MPERKFCMLKGYKLLLGALLVAAAAAIWAYASGTGSESTSSKNAGDERKPGVQAAAGDFNLQEKIDNAGDGIEIAIPAGTYIIDEPLLIQGKKDICLTGEGKIRILGEKVYRQIIIVRDCGKVVLRNISACHMNPDSAADKEKTFDKRAGSVVDAENCEKITFENCELEGCGVYGIYTMNTAEVEITGCYIHHNSWKALGFHNNKGITNVSVRNCTITNNADFLEKEGSIHINLDASNVIKDNNSRGYGSR